MTMRTLLWKNLMKLLLDRSIDLLLIQLLWCLREGVELSVMLRGKGSMGLGLSRDTCRESLSVQAGIAPVK